MEGPVSSTDPLASSLRSPSAVHTKMKLRSVLWRMTTTSAAAAGSVKHWLAEIFSLSSATVDVTVISLLEAEMAAA